MQLALLNCFMHAKMISILETGVEHWIFGGKFIFAHFLRQHQDSWRLLLPVVIFRLLDFFKSRIFFEFRSCQIAAKFPQEPWAISQTFVRNLRVTRKKISRNSFKNSPRRPESWHWSWTTCCPKNHLQRLELPFMLKIKMLKNDKTHKAKMCPRVIVVARGLGKKRKLFGQG